MSDIRIRHMPSLSDDGRLSRPSVLPGRYACLRHYYLPGTNATIKLASLACPLYVRVYISSFTGAARLRGAGMARGASRRVAGDASGALHCYMDEPPGVWAWLATAAIMTRTGWQAT